MATRFAANPATWFGLAALVLLGVSSLSVVNENEQAVVLRMGEPDRVINRFRPETAQATSGAGLTVHVPLMESLVRLPRGLMIVGSEGQNVRSADQQTLVLDTDVTVRVIDPVRLVAERGSGDRIAAEVGAWLPGLLKEELGKLDSGRIQLTGADGGLAPVRKALDQRMRAVGVQVIDVRIARTALPAGAKQDTFQTMAERRELLAAEERNRGAREVQQITSDAEAEAAAILQQSAGRDPEFYDFYRAMRSYEAIFAHPDRKDKATIVLPHDSGYLRQFNSR